MDHLLNTNLTSGPICPHCNAMLIWWEFYVFEVFIYNAVANQYELTCPHCKKPFSFKKTEKNQFSVWS